MATGLVETARARRESVRAARKLPTLVAKNGLGAVAHGRAPSNPPLSLNRNAELASRMIVCTIAAQRESISPDSGALASSLPHPRG